MSDTVRAALYATLACVVTIGGAHAWYEVIVATFW